MIDYAKRYEVSLTRAIAAFETDFTTKSAKKDCLGDLNSAYYALHNEHHGLVIDAAPKDFDQERIEHFQKFDTPFDLHHVREAKHRAAFEAFGEGYWTKVAELIKLREEIKATEVVKVETKVDELKEVRAKVEKSLAETMDLRKAQVIEGFKLVEIFKGLPVSINAHYVTNQFGSTFIRHFYYMNGKLTPLSVILYVLQETAEKE